MDGTSNEDFNKYQHVVNATYNAHDVMLQSLISLAGPDTTIILVSDHGFHSDHLRPKFTPRVHGGNTVWHRDQGIFLAKGPGIKDTPEPILDAGLLDLTPTILHRFGLPIGSDMEGRVITEAFQDPAQTQFIPTWENSGTPGQSRTCLNVQQSQDLLLQLINLGYIEKFSSVPSRAIIETEHENKWNLARTYLHLGDYKSALSLLEECFEAIPDRPDYAQALAQTQLTLGLTEEARQTLDTCVKIFGNTFSNNILRGQLEIQKGNHQAALDHLELIHTLVPDHPQILEILCRCSVALNQWDTAQDSALKLRAINPDSYQSHLTLARYALHHKADYETTIKHTLRAIKCHPNDPICYLIHGQALAQLDRYEEALVPLNKCRALKPDHTWALAILQRCHLALANRRKPGRQNKKRQGRAFKKTPLMPRGHKWPRHSKFLPSVSNNVPYKSSRSYR
jgi:tetratricopeptide (TPR) repeat protein